MRVSKQEFGERLRKIRGVYSSHLVDTLYDDLVGFGWGLFDESILKQKLDELEANIRNDITTAPETLVQRFKKEFFGREARDPH